MKAQKQTTATIGLILITFLAAVQYFFLRNVPDTVSTFSFVCITNVIGLLILGTVRIRKLFSLRKKSLLKGALFALELTGFNFFLLMGSRHTDAVTSASVISLYFVFITPLLLLLRRKVNFFSGIATVIAIIALLLLFNADTEKLFSSPEVVYLIIADIFFAAYVVSVSILGENEDSTCLTLSQMIFAALFAFAGWLAENAVTGQALSLPVETEFWISALFIGVCIRAIYGIVQISAQKHVSALKTALIFSAEIIITLAASPILSRLFGMKYTPVTFFQVMGALLLIVATLMVDENVMVRMGYGDLREISEKNAAGDTVRHSSVARKMILSTLTFTLFTLAVSTILFLSAIFLIRSNAVESSQNLGETASDISTNAMMDKLEESILSQATDKALLAEQKLNAYSDSALYAVSFAEALYRNPDRYPEREVPLPRAENGGILAMQRTLASPDTNYEELRKESCLLGNMEDVFVPIMANNDNIATIYLCTESGLMISYDRDSDSAVNQVYYEYRKSGWYRQAAETESFMFSEPYQDSYGRGLTITCFAPVRDAEGKFTGSVGIDVLMDELNDSMVNDGIVIPSRGWLIDHNGNYIAGAGVDPLAKNMGSIFDEGKNPALAERGKYIMMHRRGVTGFSAGEDAEYIAFATIASTNWILCIQTPVSTVIQPAVMIRENIDLNTENVVSVVSEGITNVIQSCLLLSALILLTVTLFTSKSSRRISDPLKRLTADVQQISEGNLDSRTEVVTDDEIGTLASSFNMMTDSLQEYIANLKEATAKEQRIAGELSAATKIQASMLPRNFREFCAGKPFELCASMDPAKEVGGDFYDYFMIDDTHLGLVMADVSGKGIPAALFMVIAKTLIKNRAQMGGGPAEILQYVNEQLCEGNEEEFFVTVWFAILDIKTGRGLAANAGHEHPVLRRASGKYELVQYRHSLALATFSGIRFREHEFELFPGDRLFVYTDGVTEATNAANELFGTDRMLGALNMDPDADPEKLLDNVRESIDDFVGEAPQFDDTTMMSLYFTGREESPETGA